MVMDEQLSFPSQKTQKTSQLIYKGVGNPKARERLIAKRWSTEHLLKYRLRKFCCCEFGKLLWVIKKYVHSNNPFAVLTCLKTVWRIYKTSQILES